METYTVYPGSKEQEKVIKAFLKALKIEFKTEKSLYNHAFCAKMRRCDEDKAAGRFRIIKVEDLWK